MASPLATRSRFGLNVSIVNSTWRRSFSSLIAKPRCWAVRNAAIDQVRRLGTAPVPLPDFVFDPAPNPAASVEDAEFLAQVVALVEQLSPDERETINFRLYTANSPVLLFEMQVA